MQENFVELLSALLVFCCEQSMSNAGVQLIHLGSLGLQHPIAQLHQKHVTIELPATFRESEGQHILTQDSIIQPNISAALQKRRCFWKKNFRLVLQVYFNLHMV